MTKTYRSTMLIGGLVIASLTGCNMLGGGNSATGGNSASPAGNAADPAPATKTGDAPAAAAADSSLNPILAEPQVDDVWAGELTHFSRATFGAGSEAYGLMRVIRVEPNNVILITETGAWPAARKDGARSDLNGNYSDITWDREEEIRVRRSELAGLLADGKILDVRRGAPVNAGSSRGDAPAEAPAAGGGK